MSESILNNQLDSVITDFKISGIKIGTVYNSKIIKTLHKRLKKFKIPIVVDPVIKSTTGGSLIKKSALKDFQKYIIPLATVITPNKFEAEILANVERNSRTSIEKIAKNIQKLGAQNVVITGIKHDKKISDFVLEQNNSYFISGEKITNTNHGSGCIYSAALLFGLAGNKTIKESLKFAKELTASSIKNAKKIGKGITIANIQSKDPINEELSNAILEFTRIENIYKNIPECQTNFVFSKNKPKSTKDILGISGRIVKLGRKLEKS